jgi:predicted transcriptional regulator
MYVIDNGSAQTAVEQIDRLAEFATDDEYGVYELFAATGQLLYVGRTAHLAKRLATHAKTQQWWPLVEFGQWTTVADYAEAVALERAAIETDGALFNYNSTAELPGSTVQVPDDVANELLERYADTSTAGKRSLDSYMLALHDAGWTLAAIGKPIGITRERVRQRAAGATSDPSIDVPAYVKPQRLSRLKNWATLGPDEAAKLRDLRALAAKCRGTHGVDHPYRRASEALTEAVVEARMRGVRMREIAAALGVTEIAVRMRLKSHGYLASAPSQHKYGSRGVLAGETRSRSEVCMRGHELAGENLRLINGDADRRVCRECERERVRQYRARLAARQGVA